MPDFRGTRDGDHPVAWALAEREQAHVAPKDFDTKPTLTYLGEAGPLDWPQTRPVPPALAAWALWPGWSSSSRACPSSA